METCEYQLVETQQQAAELDCSTAMRYQIVPKKVGDQWWAVKGEIIGKGETPSGAMDAFNAAMHVPSGAYECLPSIPKYGPCDVH